MRKLILAGLLASLLSVTPAFAATTTSHPVSAQWAFTRAGQHADQLLESTFATAKHTLGIAVYSLTDYGIVDAIVVAKRGLIPLGSYWDQNGYCGVIVVTKKFKRKPCKTLIWCGLS